MEGSIVGDFSLNTTKRSKQKEAARRDEKEREERIDSVVEANNEINRASLFRWKERERERYLGCAESSSSF